MSQWKKVRIGDICKIVKGTTGIASAEPGQYPLVVTAEERKTLSEKLAFGIIKEKLEG